MKDTKDITICVIDNGLFIPVAQRIAKGVKRVLYHSPWEEGFPTINKCIVGDGFSDIERCDDFWGIKNEIDCFVFPDIQHHSLQLELESQGFPVWGSRNGDSLEIDREKFHKVLGKVGLEVPKFIVVTGITELRTHLIDQTDKWIKISKYRGSLETFHWRDFENDDGMLDYLSVRFGASKEIIPFMVFDNIETDLEIGGDTYCVDGEFPSIMLHGDEAKDAGYLAAVTQREDMPEQIKEVLEAFSGELKKYRYRNSWSMELRVKGDKFYYIDPCCRSSLPATGSQLNLWGNYPDIIWYGANGYLIDPEPTARFSAEAIVSCKSEKHMWKKMVIPKGLEDALKLSNCCEIDGAVCFPREEGNAQDEVGWMVATGDTIEETVETLKEYEKMLPDGVSAKTDSIALLLKEVKQAEKQGIEFTNGEIPKPEIALNL